LLLRQVKLGGEQQQSQSAQQLQKMDWLPLDDKCSLHELGFTSKNARAEEPAVLGLLLPGIHFV
jgi:hypothetical protein